MSLLGAAGLTSVARASAANTRKLVGRLTAIAGVSERFEGAYFHERAIELPIAADLMVDRLLARGILGGLALGPYFSGMENTLLVCATEKRTAEEIEGYGLAMEACLQS